MRTSDRHEPLAVAFVTDLLGVGGAEVQLVDLVNALDPSRVRAEVAVLRRRGELFGRIRVPAVSFGMWLPGDPRVLWALGHWLRRGRFDVVYTTHVWATLMTAHLHRRWQGSARAFGWIDAEHGFRRPAASRLLEPLRRRALRRCDRLLAVSTAQAGWIGEYVTPTPPIAVIPNAIDVERYSAAADGAAVRVQLGIPAAAPVIVSVGRLVAEKGHDTLIRAFAEHLAPAPKPGGAPVHLLLVGEGAARPALEAQIAAAPEAVRRRIHLLGLAADTRPLLAAGDLFCLASRHESMGVALVEAMAAGLPVVATRVGGIPEVVAADETGRLVPPDDPAALAGALGELLSQPALCVRFAAAGRARAQARFSMAARAERIEALLAAVAVEHDHGDGARANPVYTEGA